MEFLFARWRWGLAVGGVAFGAYLWYAGMQSTDPGQAFLNGLIVMTVAFVFVSTDLAHLVASPFLKFIDSIYLPGDHAREAPLNYQLPIYYERHFRGEDAAAAYEAIIRRDPNQINAYAGAVRVYEQQLGDRQRSRYWRTQAERMFGPDKVAAAVSKSADEWHAERMKSALAPEPSQ